MPAHCSQDAIFDHNQDHRKNYIDEPAHRFDKPTATALEIAVLVKAISITQAAELIEQYGDTRAAEGRLEGVSHLDRRLSVSLESPLSRKEPV